MPRRMAYCPSPLLFRSTVTPDIRLTALATVTSEESSIALALITLSTHIDSFSSLRAPASLRPLLCASTATVFSVTLMSSITKITSLSFLCSIRSTGLNPIHVHTSVHSSSSTSSRNVPSSPDTAPSCGFPFTFTSAPVMSSPETESFTLPFMSVAATVSATTVTAIIHNMKNLLFISASFEIRRKITAAMLQHCCNADKIL